MKLTLKNTLRARPFRRRDGFTMIEIAISLAVIGFAVVAIIGVLPVGMNVQRDNREDTLINQDGPYFLEAIRSGARSLNTLASNVDDITINLTNSALNRTTLVFSNVPATRFSTNQVIGLLSTPRGTAFPNGYFVERVQAHVRALSGGVAEQGGGSPDLGFRYLLTAEIEKPSPTADMAEERIYSPPTAAEREVATNRNARAIYLPNTLYEIRLTFRWPVLPGGGVGNNRQVFRCFASGMQQTNILAGLPPLHFFQPQSYARVP